MTAGQTRPFLQPEPSRIALLGAPCEDGTAARGCGMGAAALRASGLAEALTALGCVVRDFGDATPDPEPTLDARSFGARNAGEVAAWVRSIERRTYDLAAEGFTPVALGGDHSISAGSVAGMARFAREIGRELHVLWLDAHTDFNTTQTSPSGNLHGMAAAAFCGLPELAALYGPAHGAPAVPGERFHVIGARSIDPGEDALLRRHGANVHDMRAMDEDGAGALARRVIQAVAARDGLLHVSLDVDFLDPEIAPGGGVPEPGGATAREAHLIMELLHESGLVASLDLVELNPLMDERGRSARLMVDLAASLFGRSVMTRPAPPRPETRRRVIRRTA